jgi:hypothetical protein
VIQREPHRRTSSKDFGARRGLLQRRCGGRGRVEVDARDRRRG